MQSYSTYSVKIASHIALCIIAFLACCQVYGQELPAKASSVRLEKMEPSTRKTFIYDIGVSLVYGYAQTYKYESPSSSVFLTANTLEAKIFFEHPIIRSHVNDNSRLKLGVNLGYQYDFFSTTDYLIGKDVRIGVGELCCSPYLLLSGFPFGGAQVAVSLGASGCLPVSFRKDRTSQELLGWNQDCLRHFIPGVFFTLEWGWPFLRLFMEYEYRFGSGLFDLDRLSYYARGPYQYDDTGSNSNMKIGLRVPLFGNGI